ncbi:MAG: hypothetical protein V1853_04085 [bacterium]
MAEYIRCGSKGWQGVVNVIRTKLLLNYSLFLLTVTVFDAIHIQTITVGTQ